MKYKLKDVEEAVRIVLLDTYPECESFTSKEIYLAIRDGIMKINLARPESRYVNFALQKNILVDGSGNGVEFELPKSGEGYDAFSDMYINMEPVWKEVLVNYVLFVMFQKNDPETFNATLSSNYYQLFKEGVS